MKKVKVILWILGILLLVVIGVFIGVIVYADHLVILAVETAGTQALDTETTLDDADLSLLSGSLSLEGLTVANPEGYQTDSLIKMGKCSTAVQLSTLTSDTIVVRHIQLKEFTLTIEQKGLTSNLQDVLNRIKAKQGSGPTAPPPEEKPSEGLPGKKLLVEKIEIVDARARVKLLPLPGQKDALDVKLGPIVLENVSNDRNKAELSLTIFRKILLAVAQATIQSGIDLPGELLKGLEGSIGTLNEALGTVTLGITKGAEEIIKGGAKVLEETGKKIIEGAGQGIEPLTEGAGKIIEGSGKALEERSKKVLEEAGKGIEGILKAPGGLLKPKKEDKAKEQEDKEEEKSETSDK